MKRAWGCLLVAGVLAGCPGGGSPDAVDAASDAVLEASSDVASDLGADATPDAAAMDASDASAPDAADAVTPGDATDAAPSDTGSACPPLAARTVVNVTADITASTRWTCANTYRLTGLVFVEPPATLTIDPGVRVEGVGRSALIVTRGGLIRAEGTAADPIVMTSGSPVGMRRPGDWGGLVLLGNARLNATTTSGDAGTLVEGRLEGISASDPRGLYGGDDDAHDCGTLRYVRIEFAGFTLTTDRELNGLTLGACGAATTLDHIHVHRGSDDGVEFFGGLPDIRYLVVTGAQDDSLDWDLGYRGRIQFLIVQQNPAEADRGIEADNRSGAGNALPRSAPTIYNATMIGTRTAPETTDLRQGIVFRTGSFGQLRNVIMMGFATELLDIRNTETAAGARMTPPLLTVENSLFFETGGPGATRYFDLIESDDDGMLSEDTFFRDPARANRFGADPMLPAPYNLTAPGFVPPAGSPAATGAVAPPSDGFFDSSASYVGAIQPGGPDWTAGWTAYPEN